MGKSKSTRPFIDRKKATSFRLLHRSQKDPLIADGSRGERVLHPFVDGKELDERRKYGIYYKDDYDYLQHLKETGEAIELVGAEPVVEQELILADNPCNKLPSCIFETQGVELRVGVLNQAAPSNELLPNIDPDVAAALDGDFGSDDGGDNELEDDFVAKANLDDGNDNKPEQSEMHDKTKGRDEMLRRFGLHRAKKMFSDECSEDMDSVEDEDSDHKTDSDDHSSASDENLFDERKSKFTNYSMSSAVLKRPGGLRVIDDHFETLFADEQYADEMAEDGNGEEAGDDHLLLKPDSERFLALMEGDADGFQKRYFREPVDNELKDAVLRYAETKAAQGGNAEGMEEISVPPDDAKKNRWDSESILTTYSNLYNHPTEIREPPYGKRMRRGNTKSDFSEKMETDSVCESSTTITRTSMASTVRPKGETPEERRQRKQAIKEERRERRKEKKANKEAFREERLKMAKAPKQFKARPIH